MNSVHQALHRFVMSQSRVGSMVKLRLFHQGMLVVCLDTDKGRDGTKGIRTEIFPAGEAVQAG